MDRTYLYHEKYPKGRIFDDEEDFKAAKEDGAVESPAAIGKEPKEIPMSFEMEDEKPKKRGRKPKKVTKDGPEA